MPSSVLGTRCLEQSSEQDTCLCSNSAKWSPFWYLGLPGHRARWWDPGWLGAYQWNGRQSSIQGPSWSWLPLRLFHSSRLLLMEEPRKRLLVCAGPLLHPEWAWKKPGDLADPHQSEQQGGQALSVSFWWPSLPWEEANTMCCLHAHQGTVLPKITIPGGCILAQKVEVVCWWIRFLMLLKYLETLKDFNFRKMYWFNKKETFWCCLMFLCFQKLFSVFSMWWLYFLLKQIFCLYFSCCCT